MLVVFSSSAGSTGHANRNVDGEATRLASLRYEGSPYLRVVVLQVNPGLLCLLLLQKLVGLDSSLSGLFRLWTTEPDLKQHIDAYVSMCTLKRGRMRESRASP